MPLKNLISSPLEAGASVLDAHRLPSHLEAALEYTARRLARKALTIDLVVIRREYQLPSAIEAVDASPCTSPDTPATMGTDSQETEAAPSSASLDLSSTSFLPSRAPPSPPALSQSQTQTQLPLPPLSPPATRSRFTSAIKHLVRAGTLPSLKSPQSASFTSSPAPTTSPTFSTSSLSSATSTSYSVASQARKRGASTSNSRWPFSPTHSATSSTFSYSSVPSTPATPLTPALSVDSSSSRATKTTTTTATSATVDSGVSAAAHSSTCSPSGPFGIRLVHADDLPQRHERTLHQVLDKAARKFHLGTNWLGPSADAAALGLPADLVRRSAEQNQLLFAAPGLTLRSLDHLYTFKAALCSYARTGNRYRLEDAVDELRRYALAQRQQHPASTGRLAKRELLRQYPSLSDFSEAHLADVSRMYSRAYGGPGHDECGGIIEADGLSSSPPIAVAIAALDEVVAAATQFGSSLEKEINEGLVQIIGDEKFLDDDEDDDAEDSDEEEDGADDNDDEEETTTPVAVSAVDDSWPLSSFLSLSATLPPTSILGTTAERRRRSTCLRRESPASLPSLSSSVSSKDSDEEKAAEPESAPPALDNNAVSGDLEVSSLLEALDLELTAAIQDLSTEKEESAPAENEVVASLVAPPAEPARPATCETVVAVPDAQQAPPDDNIVILRPAPTKRTFSPKAASPLSAKVPLLPKLKTTFDDLPFPRDEKKPVGHKDKYAEDEEEQLTAKPVSAIRRTANFLWSAVSIGEMLHDNSNNGNGEGRRANSICSPSSEAAGPLPPTSYDDISPITRSEWGFLMGGQLGRQVTVTMC